MTMGKNRAPRMTAIPAAAVAAILLAGCSSGNIGEDWQCPLAAGGSCASVAAADPAVPKTGSVQAMATGQPIRLLPGGWDTAEIAAPPAREPVPDAIREPGQVSPEARSCETECGFDPFAWLARLFDDSDDDDRPGDGNAKPATADSAAGLPADPASGTAPKPAPDRSGSGSLPAGPAPGHDAAQAADLRTGEVVARIWIAPFVDADGVYREASHVRVVLEPAGWRLR